IVEVDAGRVMLKMKVRREMLNGFGVCHGGIAFSLADSAFAFASNTHGRVSLALDASISYPVKVLEGDVLTAVAEEESLTHRIGIYTITVTNQNGEKVALFRGTVYRTDKPYPST
ncbi:MAG: hotdog fold thioesterase, partial [Calditrichaeota bacterium]